jgi:hypothetical protein
MDKIIISVETLNKVLGYLGTRPYQEVFQIIKAVQDEATNQPMLPEAEVPPAE